MEILQFIWKNRTEEQSLCTLFFFCGSDISKNFTATENFSQNPTDADIIICNLFIGKGKICFDVKLFSVFCRTSPATGACRCKIIYITESILALPIRFRFGYSSTMDTRFCFVYQLSQRMMICSLF